MLDLMPSKLICLKDLNNWSKYSKSLNKLTFVKKYLGDTFKIWVENKKNLNPLSISLIASLFNGDLGSFNKNLGVIEKSIGESNLSELLYELKIQKSDPAQITTKVHSLSGEIYTYSELIKKYNKVDKIKEYGDWLCDDYIVISVKTKNELDHNYELTENALRALYFIKENSKLRKYNNIQICQGKNIDDKFRTSLIWFINSALSEFINFQDKQLNIWNNLKLKTTKCYFDNATLRSIFEVETEFFKDNARKDIISILIKEDRSGEKENFSHQVKLEFNSSYDKNTLSFLFDTNAFWPEDKVYFDDLKNSICDYLEKFDRSYSIINKQNKKFIGWINIILHPKNEVYIPRSEDLKKEINDMKGNREYKIILALRPVYNSIEPKIFEI
jgi:hypothetical protein